MSRLQDIEREINQKADEVKAIWDEVDTKFNGEIDSDRKEQVKAKNREIEELEKRALDEKETDSLRASSMERYGRTREAAAPIAHPVAEEKRERVQSLADRFLNSDEWKNYFAGIAPRGEVSGQTHVTSPKLLLPIGFKALVTGTSDTSGGAFVVPDQSGIYNPLGRQPLVLRDIIRNTTTDSDIVEYVVQTSRSNNAAPVAEATSAGGSGYKPESDMAFERKTTPVRTIANWTPATKRALSDAGQMRGIINEELLANLDEEVEDQIINGDGTGENLMGLDAVSGTQDQTWSTNILETTRKARTKVRTVGRRTPTAYVLNPADWETIDLLQDNEARYFFGGPSVMGTPRLWGLPVVESEAVPTGWGWVGDWRQIIMYDRQQAMISVTDSHLDFFVRNLVAILAELRVAMAVIQPNAFVEIDLTA